MHLLMEDFHRKELQGLQFVIVRIKKFRSKVFIPTVCPSFIMNTMVKGGWPHQSEPSDIELVDKNAKKLFQHACWYRFLSKFSGENYGIARRFVETYDGKRAIVGSVEFIVDQEFISEATGFPQLGKLWFKGRMVLAMDYNTFLKEDHFDPDWKNGVPTHWLQDDCQKYIKVIQSYITCDFHFSRTTVYLMRFLGHLSRVKELNLVNFLHKLLCRMSEKIQSNPTLKHWHVFHKGLIKILFNHQLRKMNRTWEEFLRT